MITPTLISTITLGAADPLDHVLPHKLFSIGPVTVTNHMLMLTVSAAVLVLIMRHAAKRIAVSGDTPDDYVTKGSFAHLIEFMLIYFRDEVARPALGKLTEKYIGYVWTVFFFILTCNLLGMIPLSEFFNVISNGSISHLGGTATGNLAVTAMLASITFFMMIFVGVREQGLHYFGHFAPISFKPWPLAPIAAMLVLLEIIGMFVKPFALAIRLFANMLAGHMVLAVLLSMIFAIGTWVSYFVAIPVMIGSTIFFFLELFVSFLQAFIFTFLTVLFIAQGAVHEHDHHDEYEHDDVEHVSPHSKHQIDHGLPAPVE